MNRLILLSREEMERIHSASLHVLEHTGCRIEEEECLKALENLGAHVDYKGKTVKVPSSIVEEAVKKCNKDFRLYGREPKKDVVFGDKLCAHQSEGGTYVVDLDSGELRSPRLSDVEQFVKLADGLEGVNTILSPVVPEEIPPEVKGLYMTKTVVENTTKPVSPSLLTSKTLKYIYEIATTIAGGSEELRKRPYMMDHFGLGAVSPLIFSEDKLAIFRWAASKGFSCTVISMPSAGGTAPVTLAGAMVVQTAENLMGVTLGQALHPGLSMSVGIRVGLLDLKRGVFTCGAPGYGLVQAATAQLFKHFYGFKVDSGWSVSDSKVFDEQVGYEKTFTWLLNALAGADAVSGMGAIDFGLTQSLAQLVVDDEIFNMVRRIHRGIIIDDERLATDIIDKVGIGGNFIGERHTLKYARIEQPTTIIGDRHPRKIWEERGRKDLISRASETARRLMKEHTPEPLPKDVSKEINLILKRAEKELIE